MASDNCDSVWRSVCRQRRRGIARHKDQKSFRAVAHTDSQTPKKESDTNSVAREFAETKESFSESIANRDAEEQIETQESVSHSDTSRVTIRDGNSVCQSRGNTGTCSWKEGVAERVTVA
jgi:hypothetical protein